MFYYVLTSSLSQSVSTTIYYPVLTPYFYPQPSRMETEEKQFFLLSCQPSQHRQENVDKRKYTLVRKATRKMLIVLIMMVSHINSRPFTNLYPGASLFNNRLEFRPLKMVAKTSPLTNFWEEELRLHLTPCLHLKLCLSPRLCPYPNLSLQQRPCIHLKPCL